MSDTIKVLVGTTKGAFILSGRADADQWEVSGPHCDTWPINHVIGSADGQQLWAGGGNPFFGAGIWRSVDGGESWTLTKLASGELDQWMKSDPSMAEMFGVEPPSEDAPFTGQVDAVWSLNLAHGRLHAGTKPAVLFSSDDGGESWAKVEGLSNHPSSDSWQPGGAGLTLHTIVPDPAQPERMWIAISAAGVFATEDGGATWERMNRRDNSDSHVHYPHRHGTDTETGHCVHNMVRAPSQGDVLYQQNHQGVFRSSDGGRSWHEITAGLPSSFGFPIAVHPSKPETIWTLPLNGDTDGRFPPDAACAVWRSRDGGETWEDCREGLPQTGCFFTVLRQAMATDGADTPGLYFGTNSGSIFASFDEGDHFVEIARHLPTVLSVEAIA